MFDARRSFSLGFALLLMAIAPSVFAQKTSGTITGTVTDTSGAALADARVSAVSTQTGATRFANTNTEGSFSFPELNPGMYDIKVTKDGFKTVEEKNVELHVSDITNLALKLPVGGMAETVEVQASAIQVELRLARSATS